MKRIIFSMIFIATVTTAFAQGEEGTFSIIPRIGVSIANISGDKIAYNFNGDTHKSRNKVGFMGGADFEYMATEDMSISIGGYYSIQGDRFPDMQITDADGKITGRARYRTNLDYLNFPVMFNYYVATGVALKAGCQVCYLIKANSKYEDTPISVNEKGQKTYGETTKYDSKVTSSYRRFDISIPIGASYEYMNVILDARYNIGLYNINSGSLNILKNHNRFFTVSIGYRFQM
jgi:hypothetical protein